ncbi:2Fe-2S iron-sulfur cluster-binding protein [Desulfovirgula thermocuniculi]|uniref:2Fe-2S iron-sulfur cluster-binding protein n=1 Tax=Desulfovirgula thermocuniculi TaxID=348842 RepID=UPI000407DCD5|nr:2Fe-2S iron-sulfur cluster-binding protein [Desulfovirgula thermocuniculi]
MAPNATVDFEPIGLRVRTKAGKTVLAVAREAGLSLGEKGLVAPCGGQGMCGRCRVKVKSGPVSPPNERKKDLLGPGELEEGYRLACQVTILGSVKVEIPPESMVGAQRLQVEGLELKVGLEPPVFRCEVELTPTSVANPRSVWQQLAAGLEGLLGTGGIRVDLELVRRKPALAREGRGTASLREREVVNFFFNGNGSPSPPVGLAVDLGTTKVAGFLVNLETGETLAAKGIMNRSYVRRHTYPRVRISTVPEAISSTSGRSLAIVPAISQTQTLLPPTDAGRTAFPAVRAGESHPGRRAGASAAHQNAPVRPSPAPLTTRAAHHQAVQKHYLQPVPE